MRKHTRTKKTVVQPHAIAAHFIHNVTLGRRNHAPPFGEKHTRSVSATSPGKTGSVTVISALFDTKDDRGLSRFGRVAASSDFGFRKYRVASAVARDGALSLRGSSGCVSGVGREVLGRSRS